MVYRVPGPNTSELFVASDRANPTDALQEIAGWANEHGFGITIPDRTYTIYRAGVPLREWTLISRPVMIGGVKALLH